MPPDAVSAEHFDIFVLIEKVMAPNYSPHHLRKALLVTFRLFGLLGS
jgi:hypothetical protein